GQVDGTERQIDFLASLQDTGEYLSVVVENPTKDEPDVKNLVSTKTDNKNHGFGLKQIQELADKYDGSMIPEFNPETRKFRLSILLRNKKHDDCA
ncbi:MAG: GHKL domain-containing protein, partial [Saccharofermentanales bacterium]